MTNHITFYQFCSAVRRKGALALWLALCMLGLGLSATAQEPTIITFDVVGAGTEAGQGTFAFAISPAGAVTGAVTGWYVDGDGVYHGFLRAPDGSITTFDAPGAGTGAGTGNYVGTEGTFGDSNNPAGWILGSYEDAYYVSHGFLRARDGTITEFNAPGAGTGPGQGTFVDSVSGLNPARAAAGEYLDESGVNHGYVRAPDGSFTTFELRGAGTEAGQGTWTSSINPAGTTTGYYIDASGVLHGFLRAADGSITKFDVPGAGTEAGQGTSPDNLNPAGAVAGCYWGASGVYHSFVRAPDGTITTFNVLGAGISSGQGTIAVSNNPAGAITGYYIDADGVYHGFLRTP